MTVHAGQLKINQDQILYIDESGNLGKGDRYFVITVIRFKTKVDYRKWTQVANMFFNQYSFLKKSNNSKPEIKGYKIPYHIRKQLLRLTQDIHFDIYYGFIDTDHPHYRRSFIEKRYISKEVPFNYTLNKLFQRHIVKQINAKKIVMNIDERTVKTGQKHDLNGKINAEIIDNRKYHQCEEVVVYYHKSENVIGIQLADVIGYTLYQVYEYGKDKGVYYEYIKPKVKGMVIYPE